MNSRAGWKLCGGSRGSTRKYGRADEGGRGEQAARVVGAGQQVEYAKKARLAIATSPAARPSSPSMKFTAFAGQDDEDRDGDEHRSGQDGHPKDRHREQLDPWYARTPGGEHPDR